MKVILARLAPGGGTPVAGAVRVDSGRIVFGIERDGETATAHVGDIEARSKRGGLIEVSVQGAVRFTQGADGSRALETGFFWPDDAKDFRRFDFTIKQESLRFEGDGEGYVLVAEAPEFDCFEQAAISEKSAAGDTVHAAIFKDGSFITHARQTPKDQAKQELADLALEKIVGDLRQQAKSKLPRKATPEEVAAFATDWIARHGGRKHGLATAVKHEFGIKHNSIAKAYLKTAGIE